mmetsp:Transcript_25464/g.35082  ORF Transcript_25464/g.35082 Transcript_25464/m.35082 type:complete len:280 (-) Transcript_25464:113-952(-)
MGVGSSDMKITLNDGAEMPVIGLGVYQAQEGAETYNAVKYALEAGYRHIDTAWIYGNHISVGHAIRDSGIPREELFVTTKFFPKPKHGYDEAIAQMSLSLQQLQLDYVDLMLVHTPSMQGDRTMTWRALEQMKTEGKLRSIGVSNYGVPHLKHLLQLAVVPPAVNQCELNPYIVRKDLHDFCRANGIVMEAYSPLTKGEKLSDPKLVKLAKKYDKSTAQMLIKWCMQQGCVVIPKSVTKSRIIENFDVFNFEINEEDLAEMSSFDEYLVTGWDPTIDPV